MNDFQLDIKRIQALIDATFAVAMTILILETNIPSGLDANQMKDHFLYSTISELFIYFLSFLTLGVFWIGTHHHHHLILKTDKTSSWLDIIFLMFICVIPFSAGFLNHYRQEPLSIIFYSSNLILVSSFHFLKLVYAWKKNYIKPHITYRQYKNARFKILLPIFIYIAIIPISFFSPLISLFLFPLLFVLHALPEKENKTREKESS